MTEMDVFARHALKRDIAMLVHKHFPGKDVKFHLQFFDPSQSWIRRLWRFAIEKHFSWLDALAFFAGLIVVDVIFYFVGAK